MTQKAVNINYEQLPEHLRYGVNMYIAQGCLPGSFLQAVISNNLSRSFALADPISFVQMPEIVSFFHNEAPADCWGSPEKMRAWSAAVSA